MQLRIQRLAVAAVLIAAASLVAESAASTAAVLPLRPDSRIQAVGDATWRGNDVYNTTGAGQTRLVAQERSRSVRFRVSIQNDGRVGTFGAQGSPGTAQFPTRYRYEGNDVTAAVMAGTFRLRNLPQGAARVLGVTIDVGVDATPGSTRTVSVTTWATSNPVKRDVVRAQVRVRANRAPAWSGEGDVAYVHAGDFYPFCCGLPGEQWQWWNSVGVILTCTDPDGDALTYTWSTTVGEFLPTPTQYGGQLVRTSPDGYGVTPGELTISCTDPHGAADSGTAPIPFEVGYAPP